MDFRGKEMKMWTGLSWLKMGREVFCCYCHDPSDYMTAANVLITWITTEKGRSCTMQLVTQWILMRDGSMKYITFTVCSAFSRSLLRQYNIRSCLLIPLSESPLSSSIFWTFSNCPSSWKCNRSKEYVLLPHNSQTYKKLHYQKLRYIFYTRIYQNGSSCKISLSDLSITVKHYSMKNWIDPICNWLTTRGTILHEKLKVAILVKKLPTSYGIQRFITMFAMAYHWSLSSVT